ncbi:Serine/threonineprotein kinase 3, putative [Acanthamoeba castellanii str. Neff]|uniref:Serine/threonineprotein kinase 3, putative n=1 Tax=Acanthamoeba castellanii (strain ATCC 30010 / Neff) TaxID=1257118 RepID=L8H1J1_ACACF|nr:Serine/threonineprotein kinase 3, putative [Acanthamoeba castellanii str. Neff]ELR19384.1 Serine/threonineprotein kinase 3, putative [Acanthamoeba castellanii str. Neff]
MESCDMGSLTDVLNVVGHDKVSEVDMAYILREVVKGLIYLHSINIAHRLMIMLLHRDMKAANVLLTKTGQPKIADFGTSVQLQNATKGAQTFTGTPLFMSPEALSEESYGVKADIWSLGITAIQIADGKPPLADMNVGRAMLAIIHGSSPTLKEPKKWSKEFNDFLAVCLRKSPDDRPEAEELLKVVFTLGHPFLMNAKEVHVLSFLKEYRLKVKDRPALERTFSFIQQSDPRQFRQSHSPSAELIKQSILADSSKQGLQRVSQDMSPMLAGTGNSAGIPNSPLNAPPSPYAPQLSSSPTASGGSASSSPPMGALRHPNSPGLSPPATAAAASPATSAVGPPEIDLHTGATASKPIDIGSPSLERRLSPLTRVNTGDLRRASVAPESEARRMSVAGSGPMARPSTTYGHMTPIVLDPSDRPADRQTTTSGESGLGSKKSFHSQLSAKLDKKAEDEKKSRPSLSRPKSDRALQRQVLDSKASTLRDTKTKDKADSELKANLELRNSSEEIRRRSPIDSDEPALDAALQNSERLEDLVGILKDLLAKERLRVREASDEIGKWKKIANDLQRELDDLKLSLEHPSSSSSSSSS